MQLTSLISPIQNINPTMQSIPSIPRLQSMQTTINKMMTQKNRAPDFHDHSDIYYDQDSDNY